ncbi:MAG: hypothetical protein ABJB74_10150 [Gemmatimonas sp.]
MVERSLPAGSEGSSSVPGASAERRLLSAVHKGLLWILLLGLVGLEIELLLLKHTDGVWQVVPLVLLGFGLVVSLWYVASRSAAAVTVLSCAMILFIASGVAGTLLHLKGNVAYEKESNPGLSGRELFKGAVQGSTPTLAPGAMIQLGLLGLIVAFSGNRLRIAKNAGESSDVSQPQLK